MAQTLHYANAPITEAIIDLRVKPAEMVAARLSEVCESVSADYPHREEVFQAIGQLELKPGISASASATQESIGYKSASADQRQILQARRNGFSFSRLAPYDRWATFRDEARRLWSTYREISTPQQITRLAVRYINRIDIPGDRVDLKEFFRTSPEISPDLPQMLDGFFLQLRLPCDDLPGTALISQSIVPPVRPGVFSVVLDVDLFRNDSPPQDEAGVWEFFESLHDRKNAIFEACITNNTRELFAKCQS